MTESYKLTPPGFFDNMSEADYLEFERIFKRFDQARQLWLSIVGRDWHVGADGKRYGRERDGAAILDGPHFDPAFLVWMREQGELDSEDLADGEDIYPRLYKVDGGYTAFEEGAFFVEMEAQLQGDLAAQVVAGGDSVAGR